MTSDVTTEQKLRLVQQVRSRYQEDQYDLSNRERILYGRTSVPLESKYVSAYRDTYSYDEPLAPADSSAFFFRLRLLAAVFLLAAVIIMDKNGIKVAGITAEQIFQAISADYDEKIEEWVEAVSYNLPQR